MANRVIFMDSGEIVEVAAKDAVFGSPRPDRDLTADRHFHKLRNMNEKAAVKALAALAQEARLQIFRALVGVAPEGMTPSALSALLDIPASTLSFHLKELIHADLITVARDGRNLYYRPAVDRMDDLLSYLTDHCCHGKPCGAARARRQSICQARKNT